MAAAVAIRKTHRLSRTAHGIFQMILSRSGIAPRCRRDFPESVFVLSEAQESNPECDLQRFHKRNVRVVKPEQGGGGRAHYIF